MGPEGRGRGGADASLDQVVGLVQQRVLQPIEQEPGDRAVEHDGGLAGLLERSDDGGDGVVVGVRAWGENSRSAAKGAVGS
jgi:hypothetical protein